MLSDLAQALSGKDETYFGRAVDNGKIRFSSVSQIVIFSPDYQGGCNRRWVYQYLFGKKEPETTRQKAGKEYAESLEHYLKTGEDVLLPVLRAAQHFLPKPGPDIEAEEPLSSEPEKAFALREQYLKEPSVIVRAALAVEMKRVAGLTANNIPIIGKPDFRHRRGEYIDANGILKKEDSGMVVTEIGDLKTTSRINDYWSKHGEGKLYHGNAKTAEEVLHHPQPIGYGVHELNRHPEVTHLRLAFIYAQTSHGTAAAKRGGLLEVTEVLRRWEKVEGIAREMEGVARVTKPEEAHPNLASCISFNRPCPHSDYCDRPKGTVLDLFQIKKGDPMADVGLFSPNANTNGATAPATASQPAPNLFGGTAGSAPAPVGLFSPPAGHLVAPPPIPPMSDADRATAEAAERQRLVAEDAERARLSKVDGYQPGQLCNGHGYFASSGGSGFIKVGAEHHCAACKPLPSIGSINPADGKVPDAIDAASPLAPEAIAELQDPLKAKVEEHAKLAQERAAKEAAAQPQKKGGRCGASESRLELTRDQIARMKPVVCVCGKIWKKVPDDAFTTDFQAMMLPKHNIPKDAAPAPGAPPPLPVQPSAPPPLPMTTVETGMMQAEHGLPDNAVIAALRPPSLPVTGLFDSQAPQGEPPPLPPNVAIESGRATEDLKRELLREGVQTIAGLLPQTVPTLPQDVRGGISLYVDRFDFEKGPQPTSLEDWFQDIVKTLTDASKLQDIRYAPNDHQLSYGRWKPALELAVKANPLPPGEYHLRGVRESELKQVVLVALTPLCDRVVRGG